MTEIQKGALKKDLIEKNKFQKDIEVFKWINRILKIRFAYSGLNLSRRKTPERFNSTINYKKNILEFLFWKLSRNYIILDWYLVKYSVNRNIDNIPY